MVSVSSEQGATPCSEQRARRPDMPTRPSEERDSEGGRSEGQRRQGHLVITLDIKV
jgi:hypothetical protein